MLGLAGLLAPTTVMGSLGLALATPTAPAGTLGEIRATYGGVFTVMGVLTLQAAFNPSAYRQRLLVVALAWLGAAGGRTVGVWVDGDPGLFGWLSLAFEVVLGSMVLLAAMLNEPAPAPVPDAATVGPAPV